MKKNPQISFKTASLDINCSGRIQQYFAINDKLITINECQSYTSSNSTIGVISVGFAQKFWTGEKTFFVFENKFNHTMEDP